ncbi:FAD-dependent oxidoreductase [Actinopolymorpha pittospori]|uniref:Glycine/D-amino acid oxidase-like deaminating enzyme/nitrite reductase/ring-hydroxylating ferredoxin subunit n=1 Tax=Actinopolymorpha pittospori TaxID=648752 RepID=A0A927RBE4_9ACTN|nr:FAD-dependent oxidoreductase [Actinopolymorpha pittospori]MBE1605985.1 glycine/D-amino acid oxidase-like deaminating enzyme/nitrite reductase/ring-hydroxylating ferredoxin subunit [Actinopolymorpha pittospori]
MTAHGSVWLTGTDRPSYAALDVDLDVDLAVVGGGLVGLTTALLAQREGFRTVVLEAGRIASGTTGYTTGKVTSQHTLIYAELVARHGEQAAAHYAAANVAGMELLARLAEEAQIDADLTSAPSYAYTLDPRRGSELEKEAAAARQLGLAATVSDRPDSTDLPFDVAAAVRFDDQFHLDPVRYLDGLAHELTRIGGIILEHTRATSVEERRDHTVAVSTSAGTVRADQVVVATLLPINLIGGYFARTRPSRSYGLAARLRTPAPASMTISIDSPTRSTRPWLAAGPGGIIVVGNGHETGAVEDTMALYQDLEDWTRSTFDVEAVDYRWSAQDFVTTDKIPYVGRAPGHQQVQVATGFNKWGLSNGAAAAIMLTDLIADRPNEWLDVFRASRIGDAKSVASLLKDNLQVGKEFVGGHLGKHRRRAAGDLQPGQGGIVELDGDTVGAYRDEKGDLHTVTPTCSHLGCPLHWNSAERSWDCNCHGSRFDVEGAILNSPATRSIARDQD